MRARSRSIALALAWAVGCGGEAAGPGAEPDAGVSFAPPALASEPRPLEVVCPEGWAHVDDGAGYAHCEPWGASSERPSCADGEFPLPGEGCVDLFGSCPADGWPATLPADGVVYVRAGESGDGTRASPFGTIQEALASGRRIIAVAPGLYEENVALFGHQLFGACARETIIRGVVAMRDGAISTRGAGNVIADLRLEGAGSAIWLRSGSELRADRVWIEGALDGAEVYTDAALTMRDAVFVRSGPSILLIEGGAADLERIAIVGATSTGIAVGDASRLRARDVAILDTAPDALGRGAIGILARRSMGEVGATIDAERIVVEGGLFTGVGLGDGASGTLRDVVVRHLAPQPTVGTVALFVDGTLTVDRGLVEDVQGVGVSLKGAPTVRSLVVRDVRQGRPDIADAAGLLVVPGASPLVESVLLRDVERVGIDQQGSLVLRDARLERMIWVPQELGRVAGVGIAQQAGSSAELERVVVSGSVLGVFLTGGARLGASDLVIDGATMDGDFAGTGVYLDLGASASLLRARVGGYEVFGTYAREPGTSLRLEDVAFEGSDAPGAEGNIAIAARSEAHVEAMRVEVRRAERMGVLVTHGAALVASDLDVHDIGRARCGVTTCAETSGGNGLQLSSGNVELVHVRVADAALAGIAVSDGALGRVHRARIERAVIGIIGDVAGAVGPDVASDRGVSATGLELVSCDEDVRVVEVRVEAPELDLSVGAGPSR